MATIVWYACAGVVPPLSPTPVIGKAKHTLYEAVVIVEAYLGAYTRRAISPKDKIIPNPTQNEPNKTKHPNHTNLNEINQSRPKKTSVLISQR